MFNENAKLFVSCERSCIFWSRWTWSGESGVLGTDINIFTSFLLRMFWNRKYAIDQTCRRRKIEETYFNKKCIFLIIWNPSNQKNLGLTLHWTNTLVDFWGVFLNRSIPPTQTRICGEQHIWDALNVKDFPLVLWVGLGWVDRGKDTFSMRVFLE